MSNEYYHRVTFLGATDVGKTSLIIKIVDNSFDSYCGNTVMVDFKKYEYTYNSTEIKLALWDTAGQERYRTITSQYMRGSKFFVLVCAVDDLQSFQELDYFINLIRQNAEQNCKIILLCNKIDVEQHLINLEHLISFQETYNIESAQFISAKSGEGIQEFLEIIASLIIKDKLNNSPSDNAIDIDNLSNKQRKCCFCKYLFLIIFFKNNHIISNLTYFV